MVEVLKGSYLKLYITFPLYIEGGEVKQQKPFFERGAGLNFGIAGLYTPCQSKVK